VEVVTRVIGARDAEAFQLRPVWVEIVQEQLSVKDLLAQAVEAQIRELLVTQKLDQQQAGEILERYYPEQESAQKEDIHYPSERLVRARENRMNVSTEIKRAIQAFESGAIAIFVDGQQMQDLEQRVTITSETKIKFIRLIPLTGG
jgi:hypothetical protein